MPINFSVFGPFMLYWIINYAHDRLVITTQLHKNVNLYFGEFMIYLLSTIIKLNSLILDRMEKD